MSRHTPETREIGTRRIQSLTRLAIGGCMLGTGVLAGLVAHEYGGKTAPAGATAPVSSTYVDPNSSGAPGDPGSTGSTGDSGSTGAPTTPQTTPPTTAPTTPRTIPQPTQQWQPPRAVTGGS